jgi:acetoin utilization deacetylase AcuC-like enzyme
MSQATEDSGRGRSELRTTPIAVFSDELMMMHDPGPGHPERPGRLQTLLELFGKLQERSLVRINEPKPATFTHAEAVHTRSYLEFLERMRCKSAQLDADTRTSARSVEAAYMAAGCAIAAVDAAMRGEISFAAVRPPGHHALRDRAMGFCLLNNIAIATEHAIRNHGLSRVLIVDFDVHHGNGTQDAFYDRSDVLFVSSHQWPFYPGTGSLEEIGTGKGEGFTVNAPVPAGFDDDAMLRLYERVLMPIAERYEPQLVLVSAGFDAHADDPLGGLRMSAEGFAGLCRCVKRVADKYALGRMALMLEGGYSLKALGESVEACIDALARETASEEQASCALDGEFEAVIQQIHDFHRRRWPI